MRIAVIGNSHVAALKLGWHNIQESTLGLELVFFGAPGLRFLHWTSLSAGFWPEDEKAQQSFTLTSNGCTAITGNYDSYIVVGMGFGLYNLWRMAASHRPISSFDPGKHLLISDSCLLHAANGMASHVSATVAAIQEYSSAPVLFLPNPLPSAAKRNSLASNDALMSALDHAFYHTCDSLLCPVQHQPRETIVNTYFTRSHFSLNSHDFVNETHDDSDFVHMNAEFGALALQAALATLSQPLP